MVSITFGNRLFIFNTLTQVVNGFMTAFRPIGSFVHEFVSFTQMVGALTHANACTQTTQANVQHTHPSCQVWSLLNSCVSPEKCVRNKKHHSDSVPGQLDSGWTCRHVPAPKHVCCSRDADVWCDQCGGLVPASCDAGVDEVHAWWSRPDASEHQTRLQGTVVSQTAFLISVFLLLHTSFEQRIRVKL